MKRILIDANPIVPYLTCGSHVGIGRTCRELIQGLDTIDDLPFEILLYTQNLKGVNAKPLNTHFKTLHTYLRFDDLGRKLAKQFRLREILGRYDLQHITHNYEEVTDPSKCIVTIHDVMFFSFPENKAEPDKNQLIIPPFARKAKHIITISENSKREIMEYMNVPASNITVIPWGINHEIFFPHDVDSNKWTGNDPYFISVSCNAKRKNAISTVKAFRKFAVNNPAHHLILVWGNPSEEVLKIASEPVVNNKIHFISNLSDQELSDLYSGATASFFPSLYEGFGLPIIESMACGTPCVTARNSSLEEVGGPAAIYTEPLDIDALCREMENFENGRYDLDSLSEASIKQAAKFQWSNCVASTIDVYKKCLNI